jgi:Holliday junction DNA helicase RuvB
MEEEPMSHQEINDVKPTSLSHLIGNEGVTEQVRVAIDAAFEDNRRLDHALLLGPPGMGKSSLAYVIAQEMATPFHEVLGQNLRTPSDLNSLLLSADDKAVVHIDEIHEAPHTIQTALYMALDKRQIMVRGGSAITALPLNDFTLLLSTTEEHDLLQPLRDRMRLTLRFGFLSETSLMQVVASRASNLGWAIEEHLPFHISIRARGTPRIALKLLQAARRVCRSRGEHLIKGDHLMTACRLEGIDLLGLGVLEQRYIRLLVDGPQRINVLASALGVPSKTLSTVQEPFLIRLGLISKDEQSRRYLTPNGRQHLLQNDEQGGQDDAQPGF